MWIITWALVRQDSQTVLLNIQGPSITWFWKITLYDDKEINNRQKYLKDRLGNYWADWPSQICMLYFIDQITIGRLSNLYTKELCKQVTGDNVAFKNKGKKLIPVNKQTQPDQYNENPDLKLKRVFIHPVLNASKKLSYQSYQIIRIKLIPIIRIESKVQLFFCCIS